MLLFCVDFLLPVSGSLTLFPLRGPLLDMGAAGGPAGAERLARPFLDDAAVELLLWRLFRSGLFLAELVAFFVFEFVVFGDGPLLAF